jgi:hypothetical protein
MGKISDIADRGCPAVLKEFSRNRFKKSASGFHAQFASISAGEASRFAAEMAMVTSTNWYAEK